jgi:hypothetical protein
MLDMYLFWLAISGGVWGRGYSWLWGVNLIIMLIVLVWPINRLVVGRVTQWLLVFLGVGVLSMFFNGNYDTGLLRLMEYATAIKLLVIAPPLQYWPISFVYFCLAPLLPENSNVTAMHIWSLYFLYMGHNKNNTNWLWHGGAWLAVILTGSAGGVLAMGAGVIVQALKKQTPAIQWAVPVVLIPLGLWVSSSKTAIIRLTLWAKALTLFSSSPWLGLGPGAFKVWLGQWGAIHAHNLFLNVLVEGGLVGASVLAIVAVIILQSGLLTPYAIAFITHAMVDSPDLFLLPLFGLAISVGGTIDNTKKEEN